MEAKKIYAIDAINAYPEPVGTDDYLELDLDMGAIYVHLNYKRTKLVDLQSLDFLISQLAKIRDDVRSNQRPIIEKEGAPCSGCGSRNCNGECEIDDSMFGD